MRYKVPQLLVSTDKFRLNVGHFGAQRPAAASDIRFLRSWITYDSHMGYERPKGRVNWTAAMGMLLAMGVSIGFWIGLGMLIAQVRR
jgi:hypothetical protein